ncbi:hypothetical protein Y88_2365 [Novosphingobium nitrogenifigens DSM 19370]|uniref:Uncharacterized protein n=1 Tax=Novosphingobium nitrogenifigens DSM 19370 TaxID=983920 RepID=F1Z6E2_9SPHN|nr:hypothetical protein Y88_2365 [Novosphingobium nitrogenifigens DSM 19370]
MDDRDTRCRLAKGHCPYLRHDTRHGPPRGANSDRPAWRGKSQAAPVPTGVFPFATAKSACPHTSPAILLVTNTL